MTFENVFFIISLPRSGSTLLQQMLASHSRICSSGEPWFILPMLNLRNEKLNTDAAYDAKTAAIALNDYLSQQDNGDQLFSDQVRHIASQLYNAECTKTGKPYFLDKTSRNYLIIDELADLFPQAKFIFLVREPVSIFFSFCETIIKRNYRALGSKSVKTDLLEGFENMVNAKEAVGSRGIMVRYEDLIFEPQLTQERLMDHLGLEFEESVLGYDDQAMKGKLFDPKSVRKHNKPVSTYVDSWKNIVNSRFELELAQAYLLTLGEDLFMKMGYDLSKSLEQLSELETKFPSEKYLLNFHDLIDENPGTTTRMKIEAMASAGIQTKPAFQQYLIRHPKQALKYFYYR